MFMGIAQTGLDKMPQNILHRIACGLIVPASRKDLERLQSCMLEGFAAFFDSDTSLATHSGGGRQQAIAVLFDGHINNRSDLSLQLYQNEMTEVSDADLILQSYLRWGTECFSRIAGPFSIVIFDAENNQLVAARDAIGMREILYRHDNHAFCFSTDLRHMFADSEAAWKIDLGYVADFLTGRGIDQGLTIYQQVKRLERGHFLIKRKDSVKVYKYFEFRFRTVNRGMSEGDLARKVRHLFRLAVFSCVRDESKVAISLSGGLDSSAICCQAAELVQQKTLFLKLKCYSLVYDGFLQADERSYSKAVASKWKLPHAMIHGENLWAFKGLERCTGEYRPEPVYGPFHALNKALLKAVAADGFNVLLSGAWGDYVFGSPYSSSAIKEIIRTLLALYGRFLPTPCYKRLRQAYRLLDRRRRGFFPSWISPDFKCFVEKRARDNENINFATTARAPVIARMLAECGHIQNFSELARPLGVEYRYPFADLRLFKFAMTLPAKVIRKGKVNKYVLRQALGYIMPQAVAQRLDKTDLKELFREGLRREWPILSDVLDSAERRHLPFVDWEKLRCYLKQIMDGAAEDQILATHALMLATWLLKPPKVITF